jgi:hypothetical protein
MLTPVEGVDMTKKALVLVVAVLAVGAACGKGTATDPVALIQGSSARAQAQRSARVSMVITTSFAGRSFDLTGGGAEDFANHASSFSFDLGSMLRSLGSVPSGVPTSFDFVFKGTFAYLKAPPGSNIAQGKTWLKIDTKQLVGASGGSSFSSDPTKFFDALKGVSGTVTKTGTETVHGENTTIYSASIDINRALSQAAPDQRDALRAQLKQFGTATIPVKVWLGDDNLIRRESFEVSVAGGSAKTTIEFYDYGKPVTVSIPSESETLTVSASQIRSILGGLGS